MSVYTSREEYLKRKLKRTYKWYTGERIDGKANINDIAKIFSINLDESRLEDYQIMSIDCNNFVLEMYDKKKDICYRAFGTNHAELLNYGGPQLFVNIKTSSLISETESIGYFGEENPIKKVIKFYKDDKQLNIEKESRNNFCFGSPGAEIVVRYKNRTNNSREKQQHLLNKIYIDKGDGNYFEQTYTYGFPSLVGPGDNQDKYIYCIPDIVYGIGDLSIKANQSRKLSLIGICFEKLEGYKLNEYFPCNLDAKDFPKLKDNKNISAMIFRGFENNFMNILQIYKTDKKINVIYRKSNWESGEDFTRNTSIPSTFNGTVQSEEISNLKECLKNCFCENFIDLVCDELDQFGKKIDIRKKLIEEEIDLLNPKLYINKSFEEIEKEIGFNKEEYFNVIDKQFYEATHIIESKEKENSKVLSKKIIKQ